ncbi:hypothetical protein VNO78_33338 [Psophocarpus tetragonolobus]|uniref:Uncharacterized protein n=1 Tax=Psophocarpus tetragonolobus TaxID=3891 RepID=A0AAN9NWT5_PSOTE
MDDNTRLKELSNDVKNIFELMKSRNADDNLHFATLKTAIDEMVKKKNDTPYGSTSSNATKFYIHAFRGLIIGFWLLSQRIGLFCTGPKFSKEGTRTIAKIYRLNNTIKGRFDQDGKKIEDFVGSKTVIQSQQIDGLRLPTPEIPKQGKRALVIHGLPDFAEVYSFIGSVFDPNTNDYVQKLKEMDPINFETIS